MQTETRRVGVHVAQLGALRPTSRCLGGQSHGNSGELQVEPVRWATAWKSRYVLRRPGVVASAGVPPKQIAEAVRAVDRPADCLHGLEEQAVGLARGPAGQPPMRRSVERVSMSVPPATVVE